VRGEDRLDFRWQNARVVYLEMFSGSQWVVVLGVCGGVVAVVVGEVFAGLHGFEEVEEGAWVRGAVLGVGGSCRRMIGVVESSGGWMVGAVLGAGGSCWRMIGVAGSSKG
jgi:hypothetical protein